MKENNNLTIPQFQQGTQNPLTSNQRKINKAEKSELGQKIKKRNNE